MAFSAFDRASKGINDPMGFIACACGLLGVVECATSSSDIQTIFKFASTITGGNDIYKKALQHSSSVSISASVPFTVDVTCKSLTIELWTPWTHGFAATGAFFGGVYLVRPSNTTAAAIYTTATSSLPIDYACVYTILIVSLSLFVRLCANYPYHASLRLPNFNKALRSVDHMSISC